VRLYTLTTEILKILPGQSKSVEAGLTLLEVGEIVAETGQILINSGQLFLAGKSISDYYHSLVAFEANLKVAIEKFNEAKEKRLIKTALLWLTRHRMPLDSKWQIDILSCVIDAETLKAKIRYFPNAIAARF